MRLPFLLYPNPTINTINKQTITNLTRLTPKLNRQTNLRSHSNPPSTNNIMHSQLRISSTYFLCLPKQHRNPLLSYLPNTSLLHRHLPNNKKGQHKYITLAFKLPTFLRKLKPQLLQRITKPKRLNPQILPSLRSVK